MATGGRSGSRRGGGPGVRQGNVERVLEALRAQGPSSQASLARLTGLSPATVNTIVKGLRAKGAADIHPVNGRESVVALVAQQGVIVSVQVNIGSVRVVMFDFRTSTRYDAGLQRGQDFESEGASPDAVVELIEGLCERAGVRADELAGVGVAMQGPISRKTGALASWARLQLPNWNDIPVAETLGGALGVPVIADNDANLAALAEWTWGAGRGSTDFLYVMCSAGIGGGIVIDGAVYRGGDGLAGEIGHIALDQSGPLCFCGSRGCLTTFASERSILTVLEASGTIRHSLGEVIAAARAGDPACRRVLYEAGRYLGRALANAAKVMAPSVVAIGGVLGDAGPPVFDGVRSAAEVHSLLAVSPDIEFQPAHIRGDAEVFGAVAAVLTLSGQGVSTIPPWMHRAQATTVQNSNGLAQSV